MSDASEEPAAPASLESDPGAISDADIPSGPALTGRDHAVARFALIVVVGLSLAGLFALVRSNRSTPNSREAARVSAIPGKGPLDAGLAMVQGRPARVGQSVTFRLALDNTGSEPITIQQVKPLFVDSGTELRAVLGLDPRRAGSYDVFPGYVIPPQGRIPSSLLGGLELTLARTKPGDGAMKGLAITYTTGPVGAAAGPSAVHTVEVLDSWGVCTIAHPGSGCAPVTLDSLLKLNLPAIAATR